MQSTEVILKPLVTEKSNHQANTRNTYAFHVNGKATKQVAGFRAYDSFEQSFNDYVRMLENNDRYKPAIQVASASGNSERFAHELQRAGYATDPQYAQKINQIARKVQTYQTIADASASPAVRTRG